MACGFPPAAQPAAGPTFSSAMQAELGERRSSGQTPGKSKRSDVFLSLMIVSVLLLEGQQAPQLHTSTELWSCWFHLRARGVKTHKPAASHRI